MQHNPYSPPKTFEAEAGTSRVPRPVSVWIFLLVLLVIAAIIVSGTAIFLWRTASGLAEVNVSLALAMAVAWRLAIIAAAFFSMFGVFYGWQWGRWLGVLEIAALVAWSVVGTDNGHYANDAERAGAEFGRVVLLPSLLCWWLYAFGFSRKSKRYFAGHPR